MTSRVKEHVRKNGPQRRREILEAALEIVSKHGVKGATVSRIAAAVGLTPGALYRHFPSRAVLISEANRVANERALNWVESSAEPDVLRRLEQIADAHLAWTRENFSTVVRPFFLELASSSGQEAPDRLVLSDFKSFKALTELAEQGIRQGAIRPDVRPHDVAWALHMFAWAQDIALMAGAEEAVDEGAIRRNLQRLLDSFRAHNPPEPGTGTAAPRRS
jgi:AcrR family transcriptional regulator